MLFLSNLLSNKFCIVDFQPCFQDMILDKLTPCKVIASAVVLRLALLAYGRWQDLNLEVKFTDVDYYVFDDAAHFVSQGKSPYLRGTYRYTPLLAWILQPNAYCREFGKLFFIACDVFAALLLHKLAAVRGFGNRCATVSMLVWLFNPITCAISCRGNAESIMAFLVNAVLLAIMCKQTVLAGALFGLAVHFKIYPIIYSLAIFLFLGNGYDQNKGKIIFKEMFHELGSCKLLNVLKRIITIQRLKFFVSAFMVLSTLNLMFFRLYGAEFLEHTYFYHFGRKDIRHNFSVFFYMLYLSTSTWPSFVCFFLQLCMTFSISIRFCDDLPCSFFLLTLTFVALNKVATSQYFIWYLAILPLLCNGFKNVRLSSISVMFFVWLLGQGFWLNEAYKLEFKGQKTFLSLCTASLVFFIVNSLLVIWTVKNYSYSKCFNKNGLLNKVKLQ